MLISSKPFACIGVLFGLGVIVVQTLPGATPVTARESVLVRGGIGPDIQVTSAGVRLFLPVQAP